MNPLAAYKRQQHRTTPRIDLILALYRKALQNLRQARQALAEGHPDVARPLLVNTQLIVSGLASELPAYQDESAANFLRLYEFVAHQMVEGTIASVDAATKVLRPLLDSFEAVRDQALTLEKQGLIPALDRTQQVSLKT